MLWWCHINSRSFLFLNKVFSVKASLDHSDPCRSHVSAAAMIDVLVTSEGAGPSRATSLFGLRLDTNLGEQKLVVTSEPSGPSGLDHGRSW